MAQRASGGLNAKPLTWETSKARMDAAMLAAVISTLLFASESGARVITTPGSCVFPFIYKGVTYTKCTTVGWGKDEAKRPWCSLTRNYDTDPRWKLCDEEVTGITTSGPCVFPFIYKGVTYTKCTTVGWGKDEAKRPWCSLTRNYDTDPRWKLCDEEVTGENVALKGNATQSSVFSGSLNCLGLPKNAIDGNQDADYHHGSWSQTEKDYSPWWRVDLNEEYTIHSIAVTGRDSVPERLTGAELYIGNSLENDGNNNERCGTFSSIGPGETLTFQCHGKVGRYVSIAIRGRYEWLSVCEVQVFGELAYEHIG